MIGELLPWKKKENTLAAVSRRVDPLTDFHQQINEIFHNFFTDSPRWPAIDSGCETFVPRFEVAETDGQISVTAELPGIEEKDLDVSVSDGILCIKGEKRSDCEGDDKNRCFSERTYGVFQRAFSLPDGLDLDKIEAVFKNGILTITLPKDETKRQKTRKINVKQS